ncbi:MAG: tetratricopeptide repeat protein [Candidatus Sumerlaeaceae bacterium]
MQCPYCQTENRDDRERCYHCDHDLSMLRLIVNKARYHYNAALEHAERGRYDEAIDELHNAIDLDRSFVPAHVVLGTIYAKKGEFERAREAWEMALSLQPELSKAHRYLCRLGQVQESLPLLRSLRLVTMGLVGMVAVLLVALVWTMRPDAAGELIKRAEVAYQQGRYGEALNKLNEVLKRSGPDSATGFAARALRDAVQLNFKQKLQMAQELKHREDYPRALALIGEIEVAGPDPETSASLAMLKQDINHYYRERILSLYNQFLTGEVSYPELTEKVGEFLKLYPDIPEKEELRKFLEDAREYEVTQQMEAVRNKFRKDRDTTAAIEAMQKIAATYPGTDAMKKLRAQLVDEILSWMFDYFQSLLDRRDFAAARELLNQIRGRANEFMDIVDVKGPVELAERVLADNERLDQLKKLEKLIDAGNLDEAEGLVYELMFDDRLTTGEVAVVMAASDRLDKARARASIEKVRARKPAYLALKISTDEATQTLALAEGALKNSVSLDPAARADLLACAVAAAKKIGNDVLAQRYLDLLAREKGTERTVAQLRKLLSTTKAPPPPRRK